MPSICLSFLKLVSNSEKTDNISKKHFDVASLVDIECLIFTRSSKNKINYKISFVLLYFSFSLNFFNTFLADFLIPGTFTIKCFLVFIASPLVLTSSNLTLKSVRTFTSIPTVS